MVNVVENTALGAMHHEAQVLGTCHPLGLREMSYCFRTSVFISIK